MAEDTLGTLMSGKSGLAVLERDCFTIPVDEIPGLKVVMTIPGGRIVYNREALAGSGPRAPRIGP